MGGKEEDFIAVSGRSADLHRSAQHGEIEDGYVEATGPRGSGLQ
jgi:hypothetical protein